MRARTDRLLVGDGQLHSGIAEGLLGRVDQDPVEGGLRQPDLGLLLVPELPVHQSSQVGQVRRDERELQQIGVDDPVRPIQCHPGLTQVGRRVSGQCAAARGDRRHGQGVGRK